MDVQKEEKKILFHCAPVLLKAKTGSTITLYRNNQELFYRIMDQWQVNWNELSCDGGKSVFFLYRPKLLEERLQQENASRYLKSLNYETASIPACLEQLQRNFRDYSLGRKEFPHEIGIFLNYPLGDILKFIENKGKNYLLCSYWKVYEDLEQAIEKFEQYNRAKRVISGESGEGISLHRQSPSD